MTKVALALWQRAHVPLPEEAFLRALDGAMAQIHADVLITPELCWPGYGDTRSSIEQAVSQNDALISNVRSIAARHGKAIVLGYAEADGARVFNSAMSIGADGRILANYRKQTAANDYERQCYVKGGPGSVFQLNGVPTSLLICLDAEFPELVRRASLDGAHLLIVPTALAPKWRIVPETVIPARAYENGIFVAYCNYSCDGVAGPFCGQSLVAGPDGRAIASASDSACILEVTIETGEIFRARGQLDYHRHLELLRC